jgi:type II secretory pathway pseudopilin PulG
MLVVVAILMLLFALLFPMIGMAREWARRSQCISQLSNIGIALHCYANDNMGWFPYDPTTSSGIARRPLIDPMTPAYITEPRILYCASLKYYYYEPWIPKITYENSYPNRIGYYYFNRTYWVKEKRNFGHPGNYTLMTDVASEFVTVNNIHNVGGNLGGINRLHLDGSITWMNGSKYSESPGMFK